MEKPMQECTTATALHTIEQAGWKVPSCPHIQLLDKLGHHILVTFHTEYGFSGFELKYDPREKNFTYFRALSPKLNSCMDEELKQRTLWKVIALKNKEIEELLSNPLLPEGEYHKCLAQHKSYTKQCDDIIRHNP